jgi:uncharacterized YccA/Bax inhibitor family protein
MQTSNPILSRFERQSGGQARAGFAYDEGRTAYAQAAGGVATETDGGLAGVPAPTGAPVTRGITFNDVLTKSTILFVLAVVGAVIGWTLSPAFPFIAIIGMIGMLVLGLVNAFKRNVSPPLVIAYGLVSGLGLGGISWMYNLYAEGNDYYGIVPQAVIGTMTAFGVMLVLYRTRIVKVTGKFVRVLMGAMIAYLVIGLANLIAGMFGVGSGWGFAGVGTLGLLICVAGVLLASFSLMLDFEAITQAIAMRVPERESWRLAFGLMVTLVWLYLEILRFLAIFSGRE